MKPDFSFGLLKAHGFNELKMGRTNDFKFHLFCQKI